MNITFLIGNGFDLNLGLKTSYSDFYDYYQKNDPFDLLSLSINSDFPMWSNLELGLGIFLEHIGIGRINEFLDSKDTLERLLSKYLATEEARISFKSENLLAEEFKNMVVGFYSDFNSVEIEHCRNVIRSANERINYRFITFNYTNTLDRIVSAAIKNFKPFNSHAAHNVGYNDTISLPHHVHGELTKDLILGLDNPGQIKNKGLREITQLTDYIIKPYVNDSLGERRTEQAKTIIDNSKYICLFGLSIGDTDKMWWSYITEWLARDDNNRLVLFVHEKENLHLSAGIKLRFRDKYRDLFLQKACCEPDIASQVRNKILIIPNSNIFSFENILVEDKKNG